MTWSGDMDWSSVSLRSLKASCHLHAAPHALIAALHVILSSVTAKSSTLVSRQRACCHSSDLWHALMAVPQITEFGFKLAFQGLTTSLLHHHMLFGLLLLVFPGPKCSKLDLQSTSRAKIHLELLDPHLYYEM